MEPELFPRTDAQVSNTSQTGYTPNNFANKNLEEFSAWYGGIHGYMSLIVCFFGIPTNLINITVLTRKHMQTSINLVLTWMAVSDMLTMIEYVPFAVHFYCDYPSHSISPDKNSISWMRYLLFHVNFSATTHTISIWLGVSLAILRYKHIQSPETGNMVQLQRLITSRIVIFVISVGSVLLLIPNYMSTKLEIRTRNSNTSLYIIEDLKLGTNNVKPVVFLNLILYSILAKLIPCLLMIVYGGLLLRTIHVQVRDKRRKLSKMGVIINRPLHTTRTTAMLLAVIVLFLLTELPQGILIIGSLSMERFFENIYIPLGDLMDILALVNNGINFILYCSMNREFRRTLVLLMCTWPSERRPTMNGNSVKDSTSVKRSDSSARNITGNGLSVDEMQAFFLSSEQNATSTFNQDVSTLTERENLDLSTITDQQKETETNTEMAKTDPEMRTASSVDTE